MGGNFRSQKKQSTVLRLGLGTVQFGLKYGIANQAGQVSRHEAEKIITIARHASLDTLDTAIAYGTSEDVLGAIGIKGFKVISKLPLIPDDVKDVKLWVETQVNSSLKRLRTVSLYGLLLHRTANLLDKKQDALIAALNSLKERGIVKKIGISVYEPVELERVLPIMNVELVQLPLNLIDRRFHASGWIQKLHQRNIEIHTRSAFLQGLLLLPPDRVPTLFNKWKEILHRWNSMLHEQQLSAPAVCLAYVLSFPEVSRVIVGVDSSAQLQTLISAPQACPINVDFSFMMSDDLNLINPSNWGAL